MPDIFLSYSREDQATARHVAQGLERAGLSVWWDQTLRMGEAYDEVTERALKSARAVVVLWSKASVNSRWVRAEATIADRAGTLLPVMIEPCERPVMFELRQTADLTGWQGDDTDARWVGIVADLRAHIGGPSGIAAIAPHDGAPAAPGTRPRRSTRLAAMAVVLLVLLAAGLWAALRRPDATPASAGPAMRSGPVTLAVLPFADISPNNDQEYFADGMTEEILNFLAKVRDLQVTGRTSSFYFKGRNENMKTIGEQLGVAHLLEGSVRKDGEQLRITAQLVKAADGFHLWSQTYDRPMRDIFAVQEDIARAVTSALQVTLGVGELGVIPGMTRDYEAYAEWVESRSGSGQSTVTGVRRAISRLEAAVARDPGFAIAWLDLASACGFLRALTREDLALAQELNRKEEAALAEAQRLGIDPAVFRYYELASLVSRGRWTEAARLQQSLGSALPPGMNTDAVSERHRLMIATDRAGEIITELEQLRTRDPLSSSLAIILSEGYANAGRLADAAAEQERFMQLVQDDVMVGSALLLARAAGDVRSQERIWERLHATVDPRDISHRLYPLRDQRAQALAEVRRLAAIQPAVAPASRLASWAAFFGDAELALQMMRDDQDLERRYFSALALWRPLMAEMRSLPGFKDLVRDWGFVDYWREFGWGEHCRPFGATDFECS